MKTTKIIKLKALASVMYLLLAIFWILVLCNIDYYLMKIVNLFFSNNMEDDILKPLLENYYYVNRFNGEHIDAHTVAGTLRGPMIFAIISLYITNAFYGIFYFPIKYLRILKYYPNNFFHILGWRKEYIKRGYKIENNGLGDVSAGRGIAAAVLTILLFWLAIDWAEIRNYQNQYDGFSIFYTVILFLGWLLLHIIYMWLTQTMTMFVKKNVTINTHIMFPELLKEGKLLEPLKNYPKYLTIEYLQPKRDPNDWSSPLITYFKNYKKRQRIEMDEESQSIDVLSQKLAN